MRRGIWFFLISLLCLTGCTLPEEASHTIIKESDLIGGEMKEELEKEEPQTETQNEKPQQDKEDRVKEIESLVQEQMDQMTLEEKVGQLFMVAIRKDTGGNKITQINDEVKELIQTYHVGGIILFSENIATAGQVKTLNNNLQAISKIPLFIGVDEEGGIVSRIGNNKEINEVPFESADVLGKTGDPDRAYQEALRMGGLLKELGFNMDFAPVGDLFNEPQNTVIGKRSFGKNSQEVIPMVMAFEKGLKEQQIISVIKHFPGHGNTKEDSHTGLAYVNKSLEELEQEELKPFFKAIEENIDGMMKGHLLVPAVDEEYPASLSAKWQAYLEEHGDVSKTLLITDALDMGAITQAYTSAEAAQRAIEAGNDLLLMPQNLKEAYTGIMDRVREGNIEESRIDKSVKKILSKKIAQQQGISA